MKKISVILFTITLLLNCSEESAVPESSSYFLITSVSCAIKNLDLGNKSISNSQSCNSFRYLDFLTTGNEGYGLKYELSTGVSLVKIDLSNQSVVKSNEPMTLGLDFTRLDLFNDQLIYTYTTISNSFKTRSLIEFYNQNLEKDSKIIEIIEDDPAINLTLTATKVYDGKFFVGYRQISNYGVMIFDLSTRLLLKKISVASTEFLPLNGSQILCLSPTSLTIVNTKSLEVEKSIPSGAKSRPSISSFSAFDSKNNKVYILYEAAQPSLVEYYLSSFDLASGTLSRVNPSSKNSIHPPLTYDPNSNSLLSGTGSGNALAIFSTSETEFSTLSLNDRLIKILLKK